MKKAKLSLLALVASITLLTAGVTMANVPPPPANQFAGIDDTIFNNLTEAQCRVCHPNTVDKHHLLYDQDIPQGACSVNSTDCIKTTYCDDAICSNSGETCTVPTEVDDCPDYGLGERCGEVCIGQSAVYNPDTDSSGTADSTYSCLSCHPQQINNGVIEFVVIRDCLQCHVQIPGQASVHHLTPAAQSGECVSCHGDIVDNMDDGHAIPAYDPSNVTPSPSEGAGPGGSGACDYCHDAGADTSTGEVIQVVNNEDAHHNTGVDRSPTGVINQDACLWCHNFSGLPSEYDIRTCEGCHGYESLHNIQVDSDTECVYDPSDPAACNITVGGEPAGYGHVGRDAGVGDSDCWGCHGNYVPGAFAAASGPIVPFINSVDVTALTAGTDTPITLTGVAFTNMILGYDFQLLSDVLLTAADGSSVILTPDSISEKSLTVTIPGSTPTGNYTVQAVKNDTATSNPVGISIKPQVMITEIDCSKCLGTMTITGAGFSAKPGGTDEDLYVIEGDGGRLLKVISWTDTEIKVLDARCRGDVTVNTIFGSATAQ